MLFSQNIDFFSNISKLLLHSEQALS